MLDFLMVPLVVGIICAGIYGLFELFVRRKERLAKQLKESENKELATRLENEALQNERFQAEIESQNRELASNALVMNEKKQALHEMANVVEKQCTDGNISKQAATELQQKIKLHIGQDNEWEYFRICF